MKVLQMKRVLYSKFNAFAKLLASKEIVIEEVKMISGRGEVLVFYFKEITEKEMTEIE